VHGRIRLYGDTPGLYVGGKTTAETVEGGDAEIYLHGGTFTYLVYGHYNHGILDNREGRHAVGDQRGSRSAVHRGQTNPVVDSYGDHDDFDFGRENISKSFVREVARR